MHYATFSGLGTIDYSVLTYRWNSTRCENLHPTVEIIYNIYPTIWFYGNTMREVKEVIRLMMMGFILLLRLILSDYQPQT
jgi:hypothetical protein